MDTDFLDIQAHAVDIARRAGAVLMDYFDRPLAIKTKDSAFDLLTEADQAAEKLIFEGLQKAFPTHHIVGEEGGGAGAPADEAAYTWYIDPLDGTTNFASRIPFFGVSMALADRQMRPVVAVVYNPAPDELFRAAWGHGAFLNDTPMHVRAAHNLSESVLVTGFPPNTWNSPDNNLREWGTFLKQSRGLRRFGSAATELCWVAAGRFDGYWERALNAWDCLAGLLCVTEAGGRISDYSGEISLTLYQGSEIVASNGHIHEAMLQVLAQDSRIADRPGG